MGDIYKEVRDLIVTDPRSLVEGLVETLAPIFDEVETLREENEDLRLQLEDTEEELRRLQGDIERLATAEG